MDKLRKDPSTLTRAEVARFLGCSRRRIHQLQAEGRIHSVLDAQGWHVFSRAEVIAFAERRGRTHADKTHGTVAAEVFRLFREGVELPEVVMQTKQAPATVRALWEEYRRPLEVPAALPDLSDYEERARLDGEHLAAMRAGAGLAKTQAPIVRVGAKPARGTGGARQ